MHFEEIALEMSFYVLEHPLKNNKTVTMVILDTLIVIFHDSLANKTVPAY